MIICHCQGATDRDIRRAIHSGRATPSEIGRACGAGAGCGGCLQAIGEIVHEEASSLRPATAPSSPTERPAA